MFYLVKSKFHICSKPYPKNISASKNSKSIASLILSKSKKSKFLTKLQTEMLTKMLTNMLTKITKIEKIDRDGPRWTKMDQDGPRWSKMEQDGAIWSKMEQDYCKIEFM